MTNERRLSNTQVFVGICFFDGCVPKGRWFHFASSVIYETCSGEYYGEGPAFRRVITNVVLPYVLHSLSVSDGDDASSSPSSAATLDIEAMHRTAKRAYRILWEGARSVEEICVALEKMKGAVVVLRMSCLDLQSGAILFILQTLRGAFELYPNVLREASASGVKELVALFDRASSYAMKSAGMFERATGVLSSPKNAAKDDGDSSAGALLHFHSIFPTISSMNCCSKFYVCRHVRAYPACTHKEKYALVSRSTHVKSQFLSRSNGGW